MLGALFARLLWLKGWRYLLSRNDLNWRRLETRASQHARNNCFLSRETENAARELFWLAHPTPPWCVRGRGGRPLPLAFCGSKAGATFCLAMISIGDGLKPAHRNTLATIVFCRVKRKMRLANFLGSPRPPHPGVSGGGG